MTNKHNYSLARLLPFLNKGDKMDKLKNEINKFEKIMDKQHKELLNKSEELNEEKIKFFIFLIMLLLLGV